MKGKEAAALKRIRSDHRGFSLVELLVAIVILGIVVAPLLHTFVTSASTAARARRLGDATLAAQNLSERVEAASLKGLISNPASALAVPPADAALYLRGADGSYSRSTDTPVYRDSCYWVGVKHIVSGASSFNAMITLEAGSGAPNDALITQYSSMDAVFSQAYPGEADDPDTMARREFEADATAISGGSYTASSPSRTIVMSLSAVSTQVENRETVRNLACKLTYNYTFPYSYERAVTDPVTGLVTGSVTVNTVFSKAVEYYLLPSGFEMTGTSAPSVYLLYNPWYENTVDSITIQNTSDIPFPLFLVKQVTDCPSELIRKEPHYRATVQLVQSSACPPTGGATLYSNAKQYLSGLSGSIPGVSYKVFSGPYVYDSGVAFPNNGSLVVQEAENRLYQVTVALYDSDDTSFTGSPLYSFTSAKLQ